LVPDAINGVEVAPWQYVTREVTVGAWGVEVTVNRAVFDVVLPMPLVATKRYKLLFIDIVTAVNVKVVVVAAGVTAVHVVPPLVLCSHVKDVAPVAAAVDTAVALEHTLVAAG